MFTQKDFNDINKVNAEIARLKQQLGDLSQTPIFPANQLASAQSNLKVYK